MSNLYTYFLLQMQIELGETDLGCTRMLFPLSTEGDVYQFEEFRFGDSLLNINHWNGFQMVFFNQKQLFNPTHHGQMDLNKK